MTVDAMVKLAHMHRLEFRTGYRGCVLERCCPYGRSKWSVQEAKFTRLFVVAEGGASFMEEVA